MDIELEKLKKLEEALSDCVDILRDCQVDKTCDNCKHSDLPRGYEPCVYCRNKDDWEPKECPCADGIDSKACVGCEYSEDGKREYKPYVTVDDFFQDFEERFPTTVVIWIKLKGTSVRRMITGVHGLMVYTGEEPLSMRDLFYKWTYLDGSPCGMEVKE